MVMVHVPCGGAAEDDTAIRARRTSERAHQQVWHESSVLFSVILTAIAGRPGAITEFTATPIVNGLGHSSKLRRGRPAAGQSSHRSIVAVDALFDGKYQQEAISWSTAGTKRNCWFADPRHAILKMSLKAPRDYLDHASVLRLERNDRRAWVAARAPTPLAARRMAIVGRRTLYVADGEPRPRPAAELRAYPVGADIGHPAVLRPRSARTVRRPARNRRAVCLDAA